MLIYIIAQSFMPLVWALLPVAIIGTLKEVWDYFSKKGTPDVNDLLFTMYGALPIFALKLLLANTNT